MNHMQNPARIKNAAVYNAASDHFDRLPLGFWERHGQRTIDRLSLKPANTVLDAGCGTGASALPAADAVGPDGRVEGIDVAEGMLARAREKAAARGLGNVAFTLADMSEAGAVDGNFDAVVSVFSFFFVPDMEGQLRTLWQRVAAGGQLAVTVWGEGAFEPLSTVFAEEARRFRPDLLTAKRPWERLTDPRELHKLLTAAGIAAPEIHAIEDSQPICDVEDWWTVLMGSGFRWEIEQLTTDERAAVKCRVLERLGALRKPAMGANALIAISRKPA